MVNRIQQPTPQEVCPQAIDDGTSKVSAKVPLAEMFGYATAVRSLSRGRASYSMEPFSFEQVPASIADEIVTGSTKKPARS